MPHEPSRRIAHATLALVIAAVPALALSFGCRAGAEALALAQPATAAASDLATAPRALAAPPRVDIHGLRSSFADVIEPALASVVSIEARGRAPSDPRQRPSLRLPFGREEEPDAESFGSGVIVRPDGVIVTNNHVIAGAREIIVRLDDRRELKATLLGTDPGTDLAVLQVPAAGLRALPLGTSADLRVGDIVFAMGNPFALSQSAAMGIVSAKGRSQIGITRGGYENFIQTDAAINPGNSGGALVDSRGEMVGINTAIFSSGSRGNQGIGFAVPVDMVRDVLEQILDGGRVVRAQLGVRIRELDSALASSYGLPRPMGALVVHVEPGSPAAVAGLRAEDVIVALDGQEVADDARLRLDVSSRRPGARVELAVLRPEGGSLTRKTLGAVLRELKPDVASAAPLVPKERDAEGLLRGVDVTDIAEMPLPRRRELGLSDLAAGALVTGVEAGTPAERAGLRPGDVITAVDQRPVDGPAELRRLLDAAGSHAPRLRIERGGMTDFIALQP